MSTDVPGSGSDAGPLSDEEVDTLADRVLAKIEEQKGTSLPRRDLLKAAGVGAAGLGLGVAGVASEKINADDLVSSANAQSAAAGQIGTASSPVDLFAEDVSATTVDTAKLSTNNTHFVDEAGPIQPVIDEVAAAGGGRVVLPPTRYNEAITVPSKVMLEGSAVSDPNLDQNGTTIRRPDSHDGPVITVEESSGRVFGTVIKNLNVTGNKGAGGVTSDGHGILVNNPSRVRIENCSVWNTVHDCIKSASGLVLWVVNCSLRACDRDGIFLSATSDSSIIGCDIGSTGRHGIVCTGNGNEINGGETFICGSNAVRFEGCVKNRVIGHRANDANQDGIVFTNGSAKNIVSGCVSVNHNTAGILFQDSSGNVVTGAMLGDDRSGTSREQEYGVSETGSSNNNHIHSAQFYNHITGEYSLVGPVSTVNGTGTEDLGVSPTAAPTGGFPEGTTVRNGNADNNESWKLVRGSWVQVA